MICLELRKRTPKPCGLHPKAGVQYCGFLRGRQCHVEEHNQAVKTAFDAGINRQPTPVGLMPSNYQLPSER